MSGDRCRNGALYVAELDQSIVGAFTVNHDLFKASRSGHWKKDAGKSFRNLQG
jgi:hypothetical protein